jgi:hypothetical protein
VAEIITRHLAAMRDEIGAFDPESLNIDNAGGSASGPSGFMPCASLLLTP